jgi:hypothetical protein
MNIYGQEKLFFKKKIDLFLSLIIVYFLNLNNYMENWVSNLFLV